MAAIQLAYGKLFRRRVIGLGRVSAITDNTKYCRSGRHVLSRRVYCPRGNKLGGKELGPAV